MLAQQAQGFSATKSRSRKSLGKNLASTQGSQWSTHTSSVNVNQFLGNAVMERNFERVLEIASQNNKQSMTPQLNSGKILRNLVDPNPNVILSALSKRNTPPTHTQITEMALGINSLPAKRLTPKPAYHRKKLVNR